MNIYYVYIFFYVQHLFTRPTDNTLALARVILAVCQLTSELCVDNISYCFLIAKNLHEPYAHCARFWLWVCVCVGICVYKCVLHSNLCSYFSLSVAVISQAPIKLERGEQGLSMTWSASLSWSWSVSRSLYYMHKYTLTTITQNLLWNMQRIEGGWKWSRWDSCCFNIEINSNVRFKS